MGNWAHKAAGPCSGLLPVVLQGPQPEQADSAVSDFAARPAASHLQHTQVSPDRQGRSDIGLGRRVEPPGPGELEQD